MGTMEQIVRPFQGEDVGPTPYVQPGQAGVPPALVQVGMKGGTQTFNGDFSFVQATKIGAVHKETAPTSNVIQQTIANASS